MNKGLIPLALGGLTIGITEFVIMGLLPDMATDLHVSIPKAGYLISAYALGVVIGAPTLAILTRNHPPRRVLLLLAWMLALFNASSIIAPNYEFLFASRLLSGLPHGAFFGVGAVVASRLAKEGKEAQAVSVMFAGLTIANLAGVPVGTYIGHHFSWRYAYVLVAIIGLITVISLLFWMPELPSPEKTDLKKQLGFFRQKTSWYVIFITAIGFGGLFCWISYIAPMLRHVSGFSEDRVSGIMILAGFGMLVGNILGGKLADKFSPGRTILYLLLIMALDLVFVTFGSGNKVSALFLVFLTGCIAFALAAPIQMLMIQTAKGAEMIASATIQASFNIGNALGAFLGGIPLVLGYSFASPNMIGVMMALAGAGITGLLLHTFRKSGN